ncbi:uncharacterized protein [Atheta coriaria]|uniref:uncharacterized protein isoform X1 n=2 Tax=Dalotia coriaria TaxID=877792 RepID=UPI0031F402ED
MYKLFLILVIFSVKHSVSQTNEEWTGRWFPTDPMIQREAHGGIPMGEIENCDDGKTHLDVDYAGTPEQYTCFGNRLLYLPNPEIHPVLEHDHIPKAYSAPHYCMNETITYKRTIPSFGGHRPVWPQYGEYNYLPTQRWLHSLEHGAVVMLYHPCANYNEVVHLKDIVRNCMYRHIITASNDLHQDRPLALLTWGNRMFMSKFDAPIAVKFISTYANRAPETTTKNGGYSMGLTQPAKKVSNEKDNKICEKFTQIYSL